MRRNRCRICNTPAPRSFCAGCLALRRLHRARAETRSRRVNPAIRTVVLLAIVGAVIASGLYVVVHHLIEPVLASNACGENGAGGRTRFDQADRKADGRLYAGDAAP